jgi:hypothetical protein
VSRDFSSQVFSSVNPVWVTDPPPKNVTILVSSSPSYSNLSLTCRRTDLNHGSRRFGVVQFINEWFIV